MTVNNGREWLQAPKQSETLKPYLNPDWYEGGHFPLLVLFESDFVSSFFIKNFQTFFGEKIYINQVSLTLSVSLIKKMPLGGAKEDIFLLS